MWSGWSQSDILSRSNRLKEVRQTLLVATITKEKSIITTKREGSQTLPHQKKKSRLKNPKRLTWPPMISCTIATRMSTYTCLKLIQTHLIFPKTLILHPLSLCGPTFQRSTNLSSRAPGCSVGSLCPRSSSKLKSSILKEVSTSSS